MDKLELIFPYIMTTVIFIIVTVNIFRWFNFILQKRILESGPLDEYAIKFLQTGSPDRKESVKWAVLLVFGGAGLIGLQYQSFAYDSPVPYGIEAIALGIGFFVYFLISKKID